MNKWREQKHLTGLCWVAYCRDGRWRTRYFATWREAMQCADMRSRTCEITLPAPVVAPPRDVHSPAWHVAEHFTRPWAASIGRFVHVSDGHGWGEQIDADLAERYGLALLTAAKHAKGEQP